jgi:hypothetical protein
VPAFVYCDNNFVITAHDASEEYKTHLRELSAEGRITLVLSPWHWREMAGAAAARGNSLADFCDSLNPAWLLDRRTIQKREVAYAFYKFAKIQTDVPIMVEDITEIIYELIHTKAYRNCRAFVEHLRGIGPNHPIEATFKSALEASQKNSWLFLAGKLTPKLLAYFQRKYVQGLLPSATPAGIALDETTKRDFLDSFSVTDCPAIALETTVTRENWALKRQLNQNNFLDQQHIMAVPYVDLFLTDDDKFSRLIRRAIEKMPFPTAKVVTRADFDTLFPLSTTAPPVVSPSG